MSIQFKMASAAHAPALLDFLQSAQLLTSDLPNDLTGFTLAFEGDQLIGSAGMELKGATGLLRSVAVSETHRKQQLGQKLLAQALEYARLNEVQEVFLITESAAQYFEKHGFQRMERAHVPIEILETKQFSELCPASATVMKLQLD
jgi:amino-acid N-acetyltransferase